MTVGEFRLRPLVPIAFTCIPRQVSGCARCGEDNECCLGHLRSDGSWACADLDREIEELVDLCCTGPSSALA